MDIKKAPSRGADFSGGGGDCEIWEVLKTGRWSDFPSNRRPYRGPREKKRGNERFMALPGMFGEGKGGFPGPPKTDDSRRLGSSINRARGHARLDIGQDRRCRRNQHMKRAGAAGSRLRAAGLNGGGCQSGRGWGCPPPLTSPHRPSEARNRARAWSGVGGAVRVL